MQSDPFSLISDLESHMRALMNKGAGNGPDLYGFQTAYGSPAVDTAGPLQMEKATLQQIFRPISNCKCMCDGCKCKEGGSCSCNGPCLCSSCDCADKNGQQIGWCKPSQFVDFEVATDICFFENNFHICMDLPGVKKEDIHLELVPSEHHLEGPHHHHSQEHHLEGPHHHHSQDHHKEKLVISFTRTICDPKGYLRKERAFGHASRVFHLPLNALTEKISSKMEDGVLKITIPSDPSKLTGDVVAKSIEIS